jgi:peptide/nickel transport system permease protein
VTTTPPPPLTVDAGSAADDGAEPLGPGGVRGFLRAVWRDRNGRIGLVVVTVLLLLAVAAVAGLVQHDPLSQQPDDRLQPPSVGYWGGTDQFGRDVLSRTLVGIATSLRVALLAVAVASLVGSAIGILAGYLGGWVDQVVGRVTDVLFAFPAILLALSVVAALGAGWTTTALAIAIVYTPIFVRVARGPTLSVAATEYVKAGRVLGLSTWRLLTRHVVPNVAAPIVVQVALALSWAILTESALSFLGLGTQPPDPSLGAMVSDARNLLEVAWWTMAVPAVALVVAVVGLNLLGDGLRAAMDPRGADR